MEWINVKSGLPINQDGKWFLVCVMTPTGVCEDIAFWFNPECEGEPNTWQTLRNRHGAGYSFEVTHWMPYPELPL